MNLLIDAGNTRIKWALVDGMTRCAQASGAGMSSPRLLPQMAGCAITSDLASVVCSPSRMASSSISNVLEADGMTRCAQVSVPEVGSNWQRSGVLPVEQAGELPQCFAGLPDIQHIWVSNVAGEEIARHIRNIRLGQHAQYHFVVAREVQCGVRNGYSSISQLGSDRWAALIAAWHLIGRGCLVVNSGTATTVDVLSKQGEFIGGLILPGVELMQRSLCAATAQLRAGQGKYVRFPRNTADALFSGAIQACCGAIERQHALLDDGSAPVVLSGGAAEVLQAHLNLPLRIVDNLVLQGLLLIAQETGA